MGILWQYYKMMTWKVYEYDINLYYMDIRKHFGIKLRALREYLELTQEQFAEKVNVDRRTIGRAENGENMPSLENINKFADACNVPVSYFYDYSTLDKKQTDKECRDEIIADLNIMSGQKLHKLRKLVKIIKE